MRESLLLRIASVNTASWSRIRGSPSTAARDDAKLIVSTDPELNSPRGEALRVLLYLFERDEAIRLLRAG